MTDYTELVEALQNHASKESDCGNCPYFYYNIVQYDTCSSSLCAAAAAAIEELSKTVKDLTTKVECSPMQISGKAFDRAIEAWNEKARKEVQDDKA